MKKIVFWMLTMSFVMELTAAYAAQNNNSNILKQHNDDPSALFIGGGYSSDMQSATGLLCVKDDKYSYDGQSKSIIQFGKSMSFDEIEKKLAVDISVSGSIDMFSGSASAEYARDIQSDDYSESFYYIEQVLLPSKILSNMFGKKALTDVGLDAYESDPTHTQFRLSCGDQFIQQTPLGANLFVTMKVHFASLRDKETFHAHASGGGTMGSVEGDIQNIYNQYHIGGSLEMAAYQIGGQPAHLAQIFTKQKDHYYITTCDFNHLQDCSNLIDGVIGYAQGDFEKQVDFQGGQPTPYAAPLSYKQMSYSRIGVDAGMPVVTPEIEAARGDLSKLYIDNTKQSAFIDHLLGSWLASSFTATAQGRLSQAQRDLHDNLSILEDQRNGVIACYLTPDRCLAIKQTILTKLKPIDQYQPIITEFNTAYNNGGGHDSFMLPLGGDQYLGYDFSSQHGYWRVTAGLSDQALKLDGADDRGMHLWGTFNKIGQDTYVGEMNWADGGHRGFTFTGTHNPL
jgi:hypothetical protein